MLRPKAYAVCLIAALIWWTNPAHWFLLFSPKINWPFLWMTKKNDAPSFSKVGFAIRHTVARWESCYLWTFTFKDGIYDARIGGIWKDQAHILKRHCGFWRGIRVWEWHPGGHGIHVHVLTPDYIDAGSVWYHIGNVFGRVDVDEIPKEDAEYVSKYCTPECRRLFPKGMRIWAMFGFKPELEKTRLSDIEVSGDYSELFWHVEQGYGLDLWKPLGVYFGIFGCRSQWVRCRIVRALMRNPSPYVWLDQFVNANIKFGVDLNRKVFKGRDLPAIDGEDWVEETVEANSF